MKNYGYIYITTNKVNGKIYIGQHKSKEYDENYFGSGKYLWNAINKHGIENFENHIIEWCKDKEELCEKEKYWIRKYDSLAKHGYGYNITPGGEFGDVTAGMLEEDYKRRCKNISKGHKGKVLSKEVRKKISNSMKGKKLIEETRQKISEALKGKYIGENNPMYRRTGKNHPMYGRTHSEETKQKIRENRASFSGENHPMYGKENKWGQHSDRSKQKISEALKGKYIGEKASRYGKHHTEETKKKMSEVHSKAIIIFKNNEYYNEYYSIIEASINLENIIGGSLRKGIEAMVNKNWIPKKGQLKGYSAMYKSDYEKQQSAIN